MLGKNSVGDSFKYLSYFPYKIKFEVSHKLSAKETICIKCQSLFPGKNKKHIIIFSAVEFAQRVAEVKGYCMLNSLLRVCSFFIPVCFKGHFNHDRIVTIWHF